MTYRPPSFRYMRASLTMTFTGLSMLAAAIVTAAADGPEILFKVFLVLMVLCGVPLVIFALMARAHDQVELAQIEAQAAARMARMRDSDCGLVLQEPPLVLGDQDPRDTSPPALR